MQPDWSKTCDTLRPLPACLQLAWQELRRSDWRTWTSARVVCIFDVEGASLEPGTQETPCARLAAAVWPSHGVPAPVSSATRFDRVTGGHPIGAHRSFTLAFCFMPPIRGLRPQGRLSFFGAPEPAHTQRCYCSLLSSRTTGPPLFDLWQTAEASL